MGFFSRVVQCLAQPVHSLVQTVVEIDKCVGTPEFLLKFLASDQFAGTFEQHCQHLKWLALKNKSLAVVAQFGGSQIELELAQTNLARRVIALGINRKGHRITPQTSGGSLALALWARHTTPAI